MTVETLNMKDLEITIIRKPIKNMYLRVRRSGDIEISASPHITQEMIESFVLALSNSSISVKFFCSLSTLKRPPLQRIPFSTGNALVTVEPM